MLMSNPICRLTTIPPALGSLTSLRQLHVPNNKLTSLPNEIGLLTQLEVLKADNNRITTIPACIGECGSLVVLRCISVIMVNIPCLVPYSNTASSSPHWISTTLKSQWMSCVSLKGVNSAAFDEGADKN
ncbi:hypothetical protein F3Y22_tig00110954pilonHSYRG00050 [Hibiscus syriacus]|uniref:Uncharacterized protein n=1 Tax=Hibiscus syriacus TaxID=106335 RepID=A0A6A2ZCM5_HIBSY|nr:LRR repeats and ubiquitin-like domain-containing protein At2g30105 [Hibiscus syriacus]KAE8688812.1 hypothetical protein F3Y22_tig00110954pilonHSYRG00050 [Hibiscus syriacus]